MTGDVGRPEVPGTRALVRLNGSSPARHDRPRDTHSPERSVPRDHSSSGRVNGADQVLDLADELRADGRLELFHDPTGHPYATVRKAGLPGQRTFAVGSKEFEGLLQSLVVGRQRQAGQRVRVLPQTAWTDACRTLEALARYEGETRPVFLRVARTEDPARVVIDLGDDEGLAVVVTSAGWRVVADPPVAFRRSPSIRSLPVPEIGGSAEQLRRFFHLRDTDFLVLLAWIQSSLAGTVPFPLLVLFGEQGSAKSTLARFVRQLIDPAHPELRGLPNEERDMAIAAHNNYILAFDNLAPLDIRTSNALCRLSDGAGFSTRRLYSDREEEIFSGARPVILNGVEPCPTAADLLDRSYLLEMPPMLNGQRRSEKALFDDFNRDRPKILGWLLDGVVSGLAHSGTVTLDEPPRREDAARFAVAATLGLGLTSESMEAALAASRQQALDAATEASPFAEAVIELLERTRGFKGTAGDLLNALDQRWRPWRTSPGWPTTPEKCSSTLRRIGPILRSAGFDPVYLGRTGHSRSRTWQIEPMARSDAAVVE
jgi:putative DNA primase/helicase